MASRPNDDFFSRTVQRLTSGRAVSAIAAAVVHFRDRITTGVM